MTEILEMSNRKNSIDLSRCTFFAAYAAGLTHSNWLIGPKIDRSGQDRVHASHSVSPERATELETIVIFGPHLDGLSPSADLQLSLESRLQARLDVNGSPEYVLTWKRWDMESGPPICALRASGRRTSGKDFGGWPTPTSKVKAGGEYKDPEKALKRVNGPHSNDLRDFAQMVVGWVSPTARDLSRGSKPPRSHDKGMPLSQQVVGISGWATPAARDYRSEAATDELNQTRLEHPRGKPLSWQVAGTANNAGYLLNPLFSLWLQGFPAGWAYCVVPEIQSILGLRPSLSVPADPFEGMLEEVDPFS